MIESKIHDEVTCRLSIRNSVRIEGRVYLKKHTYFMTCSQVRLRSPFPAAPRLKTKARNHNAFKPSKRDVPVVAYENWRAEAAVPVKNIAKFIILSATFFWLFMRDLKPAMA